MEYEITYRMTVEFTDSIEAGSLAEAINHSQWQVHSEDGNTVSISDAKVIDYDVLKAEEMPESYTPEAGCGLDRNPNTDPLIVSKKGAEMERQRRNRILQQAAAELSRDMTEG